MWQTKRHTRTQQKAKLMFCMILDNMRLIPFGPKASLHATFYFNTHILV